MTDRIIVCRNPMGNTGLTEFKLLEWAMLMLNPIQLSAISPKKSCIRPHHHKVLLSQDIVFDLFNF